MDAAEPSKLSDQGSIPCRGANQQVRSSEAEHPVLTRTRGISILPGPTNQETAMHHKRKRPKNRRAGCLLCKPHKANGADRRTVQEKKQEPILRGVTANTVAF